MRKVVISILLCLFFVPQLFSADTIVTKKNRKYYGKVIKIIERGFVVRTVDGNVIVIPQDHISKIFRDNKVLDFEKKMSYYREVRHPFLPFMVLSVATGVYSVKRFQDYKEHHRQAEDEKLKNAGPDYTNLNDQSKRDLAWSVVSALFSAGSFFVALRPMEVRVPIGRINLSMMPNRVSLAFRF